MSDVHRKTVRGLWSVQIQALVDTE
jgi:hypothetical protein